VLEAVEEIIINLGNGHLTVSISGFELVANRMQVSNMTSVASD
jgi:hypothetical protein